MAGPLRVDVHRGLGEGPGHVAHPTGMIEVNMGDDHAGQVLGPEPHPRQLVEEHRYGALAARLHQDRGGAFDEVAGGDPLPSTQQRVELEDPRGDPGPDPGMALVGGVGRAVGRGLAVVGVGVRMRAAHDGATSITTLTSSGLRSSATGQESSGTRRLTSLASQPSSALANASAAAS